MNTTLKKVLRASAVALSVSLAAPALLAASQNAAHAATGPDIASTAVGQTGQKACNSDGTSRYGISCGVEWCSEFAKWVWGQNGISYTNELNASSWTFYNYGKNHGTLHNSATYQPRLGDDGVMHCMTVC